MSEKHCCLTFNGWRNESEKKKKQDTSTCPRTHLVLTSYVDVRLRMNHFEHVWSDLQMVGPNNRIDRLRRHPQVDSTYQWGKVFSFGGLYLVCLCTVSTMTRGSAVATLSTYAAQPPGNRSRTRLWCKCRREINDLLHPLFSSPILSFALCVRFIAYIWNGSVTSWNLFLSPHVASIAVVDEEP